MIIVLPAWPVGVDLDLIGAWTPWLIDVYSNFILRDIESSSESFYTFLANR